MRYYTLFARFLQQQKASLLICLLLCAVTANSVNAKAPHRVPADRQVKGRILDDKGSPVPNASVIVKGTTVGVNSLDDGTFTIHVPEGKTTLVVSSIGFQSQEVDVKSTNNVSVSLITGAGKLDDVVVVGYATQKKVTVTGAVATVKGTELEKSPSVNLSNDLVGRLPGVSAMQGSGEPGYDGSTILIRGTNTFGNSGALVVVDGVPDVAGGLERLNPADIESMSVLKDASAAIYGARAANGVIVITTKHGKNGKPLLSYTFNEGISQPDRIPKMANAVEYASINNETTIYDGVPPAEWSAAEAAFASSGAYTTQAGNIVHAPFQPSDIKLYAAGTDKWGHPNTDWFKTTLKTWSPQQEHTLQLRGGSENVKYLASIGYQDQDGYYKNSATGYKQYDMRLNIDANVNKYITTSIGLVGRQESRAYPTQSAGSIFRMLMRGRPTDPEVWPNGLPGPDIENGQNPIVITTNQTGYDDDTRDYFQVNGKVEVQIPGVTGLKITGTATVDYENQQVKEWQIPWYLYFWDHSTLGPDGLPLLTKSLRSTFTSPQLSQSSYTALNLLTSAFVNYDRKFGGHTINLMAAVTKETDNNSNFNAYRTNFISPALDQLFAGGTAGQVVGGAGDDLYRLSYFGRADYNYNEKYMFEFLWREDGSSFFSPAKRFGFFPGVSGGWRISEEKFFKENVHFINNLKLRGSWGQLGNDQAVQAFSNGSVYEGAYLSNYTFGAYTINNQAFKTLYESLLANPNFTWEVANNSDLGIEGTVLNNHINFEFDVFYNKRTNILLAPTGITPLTTGITNVLPPTNDGSAENKGYEFTVGYSGSSHDWHYSISVNGGYAKNKILNMSEAPGLPAWQKATGHSFNSSGTGILAYEYAGVFKDQKEIDASTVDYSGVTPQLHPGDMKFVDINHDGKIDGNDAIRLDKTLNPTFTGGLSVNVGYKAFDLSILFQGAAGGLLGIATESGDIGNYLQYSYDHQWTIDHPSSVDPRLANRNDTYYTGGAYSQNTYFLRSNNYIRLKNVEIGYTLPPAILKKAGINALRIYVNGLNLITWDKMKIWDPESQSGSGQYYPQARIINGGVRVTF